MWTLMDGMLINLNLVRIIHKEVSEDETYDIVVIFDKDEQIKLGFFEYPEIMNKEYDHLVRLLVKNNLNKKEKRKCK